MIRLEDIGFKTASLKGQERLASAYQAVFEGRGTKADCGIVLGDLASYSGFFTVLADGASDADLRDAEGRRKVFARILLLTDVSVAQLFQAAQTLNVVDAGEENE